MFENFASPPRTPPQVRLRLFKSWSCGKRFRIVAELVGGCGGGWGSGGMDYQIIFLKKKIAGGVGENTTALRAATADHGGGASRRRNIIMWRRFAPLHNRKESAFKCWIFSVIFLRRRHHHREHFFTKKCAKWWSRLEVALDILK